MYECYPYVHAKYGVLVLVSSRPVCHRGESLRRPTRWLDLVKLVLLPLQSMHMVRTVIQRHSEGAITHIKDEGMSVKLWRTASRFLVGSRSGGPRLAGCLGA